MAQRVRGAPPGQGAVQQQAMRQPSHVQSLALPSMNLAWTEHTTPEGRKFYFNRETKQSTFVKPDIMKSAVEKKLPTSDWKEYIKGDKRYYYNSATKQSAWEEPMELTMYRERLSAMCDGDEPTKDMESRAVYRAAREALEASVVGGTLKGSEKENDDTKPERVVATKAAPLILTEISGELNGPGPEGGWPKYDSHEDARKAFQQMLMDKKVPSDATWAEALNKGIANDKRFHALKRLAQRKEAFGDFAEMAKQLEEDERKKARAAAEVGFKAMLQEAADAGRIHGKSRTREAPSLFEDDPRWAAARDERDREDWFHDFVDELYEKTKEERRAQRKKRSAAMQAVLSELHEKGEVTADSTWETAGKASDKDGDAMDVDSAVAPTAAAKKAMGIRSVLENLKDERLVGIEAKDQEPYFREFLTKLKEEKRERERKEAEERREQERKARNDFKEWLGAAMRTGDVPFVASETWSSDISKGKDDIETKGETAGPPEVVLKHPLFESLGDKRRVVAEEIRRKVVSDMKLEAKDCLRSLRRLKLHRGFAPGTAAAPATASSSSSSAATKLSLSSKPSLETVRAALKAQPDPAADSGSKEAERSSHAETAVLGLEELGTKYGEPLMRIALDLLCEEAILDAEEDKRRLKRRQDRFVDLLRDYVYKTEHVGLSWDKVKQMVSKRSAFLDLKTDDKRIPLFEKYMASWHSYPTL